MLEDLARARAMDAMLCQRIVCLSWRLGRAQRIQNMVFEALFARGISDFRDEADAWLDNLDEAEPEQGRDALATDLALGRAITGDFANSKVLERLLAYEGKIEGNQYKAMAELEKLRRVRRSDGPAAQNKANLQAEGQRHRGTKRARSRGAGRAKQSQFGGATAGCRHG